MNNQKPLRFLILKIVGILGIGAFVFGIILAVKGFGDFETNNFMIGSLLIAFGLMLGIGGLVMGFRPEITKMTINTAKYIQQENKAELQEVITTSAEIAKDAVSTTSKAIKEGFSENKKFCKYCGAQIDGDSLFCNKCGKQQ